jgi:spermidine synthase
VKPWVVLGKARTPDGTELTLTSHASEYVITANRESLMSSRAHGSEDALATLGCRQARQMANPRVLIGGLGMGFTLRAALDVLPASARVVVAELVPAVVEWNRGALGEVAKRPLEDPRVRVEESDVAVIIRRSPAAFDAVLLDVDNGPAAMTTASNADLYSPQGLSRLRASLAPGGVLAVWSARDESRFERTLHAAGFDVKRERVNTRSNKRGARHTILVAHNTGAAE